MSKNRDFMQNLHFWRLLKLSDTFWPLETKKLAFSARKTYDRTVRLWISWPPVENDRKVFHVSSHSCESSKIQIFLMKKLKIGIFAVFEWFWTRNSTIFLKTSSQDLFQQSRFQALSKSPNFESCYIQSRLPLDFQFLQLALRPEVYRSYLPSSVKFSIPHSDLFIEFFFIVSAVKITNGF